MNHNQQRKPASSTEEAAQLIQEHQPQIQAVLHRFLTSSESCTALSPKIHGLLSAWLEQKLKRSLKKPTHPIPETWSASAPAWFLNAESHHYFCWGSLIELRNTILRVPVRYPITSFCYESLIFCAQRIALFPLDVFFPHVHLLSLLRGILRGHRGSIAVQTFHHCLVFLKQQQCFSQQILGYAL